MNRPRADHPSALALDELALGLLPADEAEAARAHVERCAACRAAVDAAAAARAHFDRVVLERTLPSLRRESPRFAATAAWRARARRHWRRLGLFVALPAVAAMAIVLLASRAGWRGEPNVSSKGGPAMQVYARRGDRVFAVREGMPLERGDGLRFVVEPAGRRWLLVASIDGAGKASVYFPWAGARSGELGARARVELPDTVELDEAPGPERLFALFSDEPLEAREVLAQLASIGSGGAPSIRAARRLPRLPSSIAQVSLVYEKEDRAPAR